MTEAGLPLEGVRVVEMTRMVMGPTCGMILAQLGAEVIKVEPPAGDKTHALGGMGTAFFPLFNRGKRSVVPDLEKPEDRDTMHRLLETADVSLENFRDGQLEKQGLTDPHVLRPGGLVTNITADGEPFHVPTLPIEWNGGHLGEGLKVAPLGADTSAVRAEIDNNDET
jgi:hypothetical protein